MRIVVAGTRGIPNIQGGVETHCEELFPRIAALGHQVILLRRSCYVSPDNKITEFRGVKLCDIYAPRKKSIEAIVHTFLAVIKARRLNADILHIHAIGPSIMSPFARLLGLKVVTTHHGPDYDRGKWGKMAKWVLRFGEKMGARFSNRVIVISKVIAEILRRDYNRTDTDLIFNGVTLPVKSNNIDYIEKLGVKSGHYVLAVGRFVPEKNFHLLIEAFSKAGLAKRGYQLVIAGDADHEDNYSLHLKELARDNNVILTGFIKGERLNQLFTNARLFVLPSSHEGLPISLLEAMSYGLDVLVSSIPANCIPELSDDDFFSLSDKGSLINALERKLSLDVNNRTYNLDAYNWDYIAIQTINVYRSAMSGNKSE